MNIKEEYARLLELSKNKEGFQQVNDLWQVASGYERRADGFWYKNCIGCGNLVAGFAIDPLTWEYVLGTKGGDHGYAKNALIVSLMKTHNLDDLEDRVIDCRAAYAPDWQYPLVTMNGMWQLQDPDLLKKVEEKILELGIGLPLSSLFSKYNRA